jgi:FKBP-type peptidyl-prolyl cis-trans isomerase FklB
MRVIIAVLSIVFLTGSVYAEEKAEEKNILKSQRDKVSYGIGIEIGNSLKHQSIDIDQDILSRGIKDILSGKEPLMTEQELQETMANFKKEIMAKQMERMKEIADKNKKDGEAFLAGNSKKEGVVTLPSGLQYKVVKEGTGATPNATDTVTVNYRGTLIDGTEFDSSERHGQSATFQVNAVIPGWTEALQLMKVGSKWQLYLPSNLAYGERGAGRDIGPNATLIFDVELLSTKESTGDPHGENHP